MHVKCFTLLLLFILVSTNAQEFQVRESKIFHPRFEFTDDYSNEYISRFGGSVCSLGDLDDDGIPEIAVGVPYYSRDSHVQIGDVYIIYLNNDGSIKDSVKLGDIIYITKGDYPAMFGSDLALLNNDTLAISATGTGMIYIVTGLKSRAYIYTSISRTDIDSSLYYIPGQFAPSIAELPDLDGDGNPEILVGVNRRIFPIYDSQFLNFFYIVYLDDNNNVKNAVKHDFFTAYIYAGFSVANLGNLTGFQNEVVFALSAPRYDNYKGAIMLYSIRPFQTPSFMHTITASSFLPEVEDNANFGSSFSNIGDLDGDGINDIIVEAFGFIYVLFLDQVGAISTYQQIKASILCEACFSFAPLGDFDGDGSLDILAGGNAGGENEVVWILYVNEAKWTFTIGVIIALSVLGFFTFVSLGVCCVMARDSVYI